ncbi:papain-like cysteine protease family protein [Streptomyces sp. NPDC052396]|uniref:papain-like cysteine protease family protein n=1 Tax=Streptomyces sp. NPDC052396 TaxID=3365689 RepID=UPI0037D383E0
MSRASAQQQKSRIRGRALSAAAVAAAALVAIPAATANAATPQAGTVKAKQLKISMQAQQKDQWCWAASGNTIAAYFHKKYSQNQFCNAAWHRKQGTNCPNNPASLENDQNAFKWMHLKPGSVFYGYLYGKTIINEINANRPVEARIGWKSGGGHMHVIYGYDRSKGAVYFGDPWPSSRRYNRANYDWYVNNSQFAWTHSLYQIGR